MVLRHNTIIAICRGLADHVKSLSRTYNEISTNCKSAGVRGAQVITK